MLGSEYLTSNNKQVIYSTNTVGPTLSYLQT